MLVLGSAQLHPEERSLTIGGRTVALQRKPYLVLQYLIENRDRLILRKELLDLFWDGREVYDESLSKAVGSIRKAFGETRDGQVFIETRWGIGYRYVGPFGQSPAAPVVELAGSVEPEGTVLPLATVTAVPASIASVAGRVWQWPAGVVLLGVPLAAIGIAALLVFHHDREQKKPILQPAPVRSVAVPPYTGNPQAYAEYMKAEFFAGMRTQASLARAIGLLNEVILLDPRYARAYAALADCYQLQGFYHFVSPADAYPRARAAALKALAMDNSLLEAHISLLSTLTDYDWDWLGAEREFKAATAINPNYAVAYQYYGYSLLAMGHGDEAIGAMKHAAELDPVSPSVLTTLAWGYFMLRRNGESFDQCKRVLELYPDFVPAHQVLGIVYGQMNLGQRSMAELTQAQTLERDSAITPILIDYQLAFSGKRLEAAQNLERLQARARGAAMPDYYLAAAWVAVGDKAKAQAFLQRAYDAHSNWVIYVQFDPRFDAMHENSEFQSLVHRVSAGNRPAGIGKASNERLAAVVD